MSSYPGTGCDHEGDAAGRTTCGPCGAAHGWWDDADADADDAGTHRVLRWLQRAYAATSPSLGEGEYASICPLPASAGGVPAVRAGG